MNSNWNHSPETLNLGQNWWFFSRCDINWWMTLTNNRAHILCYFKLCASFHSHLSIQNGVTVRKLWVKISDFNVLCDLQIWRITLKNNRAPLLCYIKLSASFHSHMWIQNGATVRKRSIWVKIGESFVLCDLEIWRMTLKNNRAPLLCYFKLSASFHSHLWIQNGFTVQKHQIWVKIADFCPVWPWNLTDDIEKH